MTTVAVMRAAATGSARARRPMGAWPRRLPASFSFDSAAYCGRGARIGTSATAVGISSRAIDPELPGHRLAHAQPGRGAA